MSDVVVTGLGALGSYGCGADRLAAALKDSTSRFSEVDRTAGHEDGGARLAALVGSVDLSPWLNAAAARRMSGPSKLAVAAATMALRDAGLEEVDALADGTGVVMSTTFGPVDFTERLFTVINREGPESASPFLFTESVANAPRSADRNPVPRQRAERDGDAARGRATHSAPSGCAGRTRRADESGPGRIGR